jgi:hypothetical protein
MTSPRRRILWTAAVALAAVVLTGRSDGHAAGAVVKAPRIVAAVMQDADGDFRADGVRLTYSARIRHALDGDGSSPFTVAGYAIRSVDAANGKTLVIELVEGTQPDPAAAPAIRYRRTTSDPVRNRAGEQAANQLFRATQPHGHAPPPPPSDSDGDGIPDPQDCAPRDAAIHPGAPDLPDLSFVDSNCDGIDGTETDAVFVSPNGNDANPGTRAQPKREIQAAIDAAKASVGRYVLVADGSYQHVKAATSVSIYGGYDPNDWSQRSASLKTEIAGVPEGILADGATRVTLQLLSVRGSSDPYHPSAYGIRAINGSALTLQRVSVAAGAALDSHPRGTDGFYPGRDGGRGENGERGACDHEYEAGGGEGGTAGDLGGNAGFHGGGGGFPGYHDGRGGYGPGGGAGGKNGDHGEPGGTGADGLNGIPGRGGPAGVGFDLSASGTTSGYGTRGEDGGDGGNGTDGQGGSGGGGGGGQPGLLEPDIGNGGGGGGGGGEHGELGQGGEGGAGSFGISLYDSALIVESSSITTGDGAPGGNGGNGTRGGAGGARGYGGAVCLSTVGRGGRGGLGGNGGSGGGGGGGAGGPSIGIFKGGTSKATVRDSAIKIGTGGAGGLGGAGGPGVLGGPNGGIGEDGKPGLAAKVYP